MNPSKQHSKEKLVEIKHVSKTYWIKSPKLFVKPSALHALSDVNLTVYQGETLGVIGESGCGKTTLGKCVIRLINASSGEIFFKGEDILKKDDKALRSMRRQMSMVFQDPYSSLDPRKTVGKQISIPLDIHHIGSQSERKELVEELLEDVGLSPYHAIRYPHEFSGGQRQRVNIARALAANPDFIICDEPVSALDVSVQSQVLNLLNSLKHKHNLTYMFISHDLSVVKYISNRIAVMYLGQIVELGAADTIYVHAAHPYTQALLSSIPPESPYHKREGVADLIRGEVSTAIGTNTGCAFYPRCPYAKDICLETKPQLTSIDGEHQVACFLY